MKTKLSSLTLNSVRRQRRDERAGRRFHQVTRRDLCDLADEWKLPLRRKTLSLRGNVFTDGGPRDSENPKGLSSMSTTSCGNERNERAVGDPTDAWKTPQMMALVKMAVRTCCTDSGDASSSSPVTSARRFLPLGHGDEHKDASGRCAPERDGPQDGSGASASELRRRVGDKSLSDSFLSQRLQPADRPGGDRLQPLSSVSRPVSLSILTRCQSGNKGLNHSFHSSSHRDRLRLRSSRGGGGGDEESCCCCIALENNRQVFKHARLYYRLQGADI
ncbi:hypothetical protein F2P81_018182 [Scophthalmus maximus]|uniref:Uncharacterized protein n=1 Tax=Scophthalmus maximus TaxID=52904 RepID=A0A6A4S7I7_SCOMX|nr:hypothetical protein F2P81_018182 [Scophthalmus maximus]